MRRDVLGSALIGIALAGIGLLGVQPYLPASAGAWLNGTPTTAFSLACIGLLVSGLGLRGAHWFDGWISIVDHHVCVLARSHDDLRCIYTLAQEHFGNDISPMHLMKDWRAAYRRTFSVIRRFRPQQAGLKGDVVGYFCLLPLKKAAAEMIMRNELRGSGIREQDLALKKCHAIYLGAVVAKGRTARALALAFVRRELESQWPSPRRMRVLTRPLTRDGLRLVKHFGFMTPAGGIPQIGDICSADVDQIVHDMPTLQSYPARRRQQAKGRTQLPN